MNLPNIITLSRIVFLIVIAVLIDDRWTGAATLVFFLALIAAMSDWIDGWIARKYGMITDFGKIADALVDKIMVIGMFVILWLMELLGDISGWLGILSMVIIVLTALRDTLITGMRFVAANKGVILAADKMGKRKAIWQITATCVLFAVPMIEYDFQRWTGMDLYLFRQFVWFNGLLYFLLGGGLSIYSGLLYIVKYLPMVARAEPTSKEGEVR